MALLFAKMLTGAGGYSTVRWRESPLIEWLQAHPLDGVIYSNYPDAIYILTGQKTEKGPKKFQPASTNSKGDDLQQFKELLKLNNRTYLVWFLEAGREYLYNIQELHSAFVLEKAAVFSDGTVYLFRQKG